MRPLGVSTRALIAELYDGGVSQQPGPRSVLAMVAASREPAAVLELVPLLLKGGAVADEVARAMAEILTDQPARVFAQLEAVRSQGGCECCRWGQWTTLRPDDVSAIARLSHAWAPLGIMSYHPSGFVREAAVRALARRTDGREVPFLVLRVNDWVAEVRAVAPARAVRVRRDAGPRRRRGAGLGVPTANVNVDDHMAVPCKGVYAAKVRVGASTAWTGEQLSS